MRDLHAAQEVVQSGNIQDVCQQRLCRQWADFCFTLSVVPTLQNASLPQVEILQVYGHRVKHSHYYKQHMKRIGKDSFSQAWGMIAATHLLDGLPNPRKPPGAQAHTGLYRRLARQLKT